MTLATLVSIRASDAAPRKIASAYPAEFARRMQGRLKRPLGDLFGLTDFGVNLTTLEPGAQSALLHTHSRQDEFVFVLSGTVTLRTQTTEAILKAGDCAGFKAGDGLAHHLLNRGAEPAVYLEIGSRVAGDEGSYPEDDLLAVHKDGRWIFTHRDGTPYID